MQRRWPVRSVMRSQALKRGIDVAGAAIGLLVAAGPGAAIADDERLTPLGRFLRSTSLDELSEL